MKASRMAYLAYFASLGANLRGSRMGSKTERYAGVRVEKIGTVLKKKDGLVTAFRYERKPNGQIVKVAA